MSTTQPVPLAPFSVELLGAGQVGGALLAALDRTGIPISAIHRRKGSERRGPAQGRSILVDATPPVFAGPAAEAWVQRLATALRSGTSVVTCNKAPLAIAWDLLRDATRSGGTTLALTATVGGGTPILAGLRALQAESGLAEIQATLSGTLGVVVPRVHAGASIPEAVAEAQAAGYCEPDPALDLDGTDAWAKACILHDSLWPDADPVQLRHRPAPLALQESAVRALRHPAVVARIAPGRVSLGLQEWDAPSARAARSGILVRAHLGDGRVAELSGTGAGPGATAAALLSDVQAVAAGRCPPGFWP